VTAFDSRQSGPESWYFAGLGSQQKVDGFKIYRAKVALFGVQFL